jgi:hypothetical protein
LDNLWRWLEPWRENGATGPVVIGGDKRGSIDLFKDRFQRKLERLHKQSDEVTERMVKWPHNVVRHSYASYRFAVLRDLAKLAAEMGNSTAMQLNHYQNAQPLSAAKEWFSVFPADLPNVLQFNLPGLTRAMG